MFLLVDFIFNTKDKKQKRDLLFSKSLFLAVKKQLIVLVFRLQL